MTQRWGHDQEERQACTKKAQDAYSIARQAMERIGKLEQDLTETRAELLVAQEYAGRAVDRLRALVVRVEALESIDTTPKKDARVKSLKAAQELPHGRC